MGEKEADKFRISHADRIFRTAVNDTMKGLPKDDTFRHFQSPSGLPKISYNGEEVIFAASKLEEINGKLQPAELVGDIWTHIGINNLHKEGGVPFPNGKKPYKLIKDIVKLSSERDSVVLDFFSGSATTAEAVFRLNCEDGGNRQFILVQLDEPIKEPLKNDKNIKKMGISTIDELGMKRIEKTAEAIATESRGKETDLGFKHFTLKSLPQETLDKIEVFDADSIRAIGDVENIADGIDKNMLLATWVNNDGYGLSREPEKIDLAGYPAYYMIPESGNGGHIYLVDKGLTEDAIDRLICLYEDEKFNPETIVLFGYNFAYRETTELRKNLQRLDKNGVDTKVSIETRY